MNDHPDAITVAKCHPFRGDNFYITLPGSDRSGVEYIPASDARLAVALAYQKAGAMVSATAYTSNGDKRSLEPVKVGYEGADQHHATIAAAILALADQDDLAEVQALKAERDSFRAVLEGACYGDIDGIGKNSVEMSRMLGDAVMQMTKARLTRAEAAEAEVARLRALIPEVKP